MSPWLHTHGPAFLSLTMQALQAALNEAELAKVNVSISILNASGELLHGPHGWCATREPEISRRKAATAVAFGVPTPAWEESLQEIPPDDSSDSVDVAAAQAVSPVHELRKAAP